MKFVKSLLIVFIALLSLNATAREAVPIVNYDDIAVATNSGKAPSAEQVKQAIIAAASNKGWSIAHQADGQLLATLVVRNKHTIVVSIACAADKYSLRYKDSINMKFEERDGQQLIHPYYNKWVLDLKDAIRIELLKL
ncbi:MAG: hypothetical protein H6R17_2060 [Proteobacteria bacterium]|nr:hypothetical protein [Pseudomonadota bacterium]